MQPRIRHATLVPELAKSLAATSHKLHAGSLPRSLIDLVDVRISQINGCAYCLDLHAREFLASDGDLQRLVSLPAWRETDAYSARERAALAWAESLTRVADTNAPDTDFEPLREHFSDTEIAELTYAIAVMNAWNRLGVGLRSTAARKPLAG